MGMGFAFYQASGAVISDLRLATTSTFTVSLSECLDDATWTDLFYQLVPTADPSTTSVAFIGEPAECGGSSKALVSGLTFAVTSIGSSAPAITNGFTAASNGAAGAAAGINSAALIGGTAGASAAGIPAGAAGGGGGAAGGLSGGAIAGIVIGSVAGGVLLLGVSAIVVGAVVVAAVVVAKSGDDDSTVESGAA